jgi:hypothetical protein
VPKKLGIAALCRRIERDHFVRRPLADVGARIASLERREGIKLPRQLKDFYRRCNGAKLFERADPPYHLLPLSGIKRARTAIAGEDSDEVCPATWYTVCTLPNDEYVGIDVKSGRIIDLFHETLGDGPVIAPDLATFVGRALGSEGVEGYWLKRGRSKSRAPRKGVTRERAGVKRAAVRDAFPVDRLRLDGARLEACVEPSGGRPTLIWRAFFSYKTLRVGGEEHAIRVEARLPSDQRSWHELAGEFSDTVSIIAHRGFHKLRASSPSSLVKLRRSKGVAFTIDVAADVRIAGFAPSTLIERTQVELKGLLVSRALLRGRDKIASAKELAARFVDLSELEEPEPGSYWFSFAPRR